MQKSDYYIRTVEAGRYVRAVRYKRALPSDRPAVRAAKAKTTSQAQAFVNCKNAAEKLNDLLCCNFDRKDAYFVTLTFDTEHLPESRSAARKRVTAYLRRLKSDFKRRETPLYYVYIIEGQPQSTAEPVDGDLWEVRPWQDAQRWEQLDRQNQQRPAETQTGKRLHVHAFFILDKQGREAVRALWKDGHVYSSQMKVNAPDTFQRLAYYATKEQRAGETGVGDRSYTPSLNLKRPKVTGHWATECEDVTAPEGAYTLENSRTDTPYTSIHTILYRLPRAQQQPTAHSTRESSRKKRTRKTKQAQAKQRRRAARKTAGTEVPMA